MTVIALPRVLVRFARPKLPSWREWADYYQGLVYSAIITTWIWEMRVEGAESDWNWVFIVIELGTLLARWFGFAGRAWWVMDKLPKMEGRRERLVSGLLAGFLVLALPFHVADAITFWIYLGSVIVVVNELKPPKSTA